MLLPLSARGDTGEGFDEQPSDDTPGDSGAKRLKLSDDNNSANNSLNTRGPYPTPEYRGDHNAGDCIGRSAARADLEVATSSLSTDLIFDKRRPRLAAYHPFTEIVETEVPTACAGFLGLYELRKKEGYANDALETVYNKIPETCTPKQKYSKTNPVVFIGVMGAGKSQLVSALLGIPDIAVTSDSERGTNIVHEFAGLMDNQETLFVVEAVYYPSDRIEKRVMKICQSVFDFFDLDKRQETDPDSVEDGDLDELNDRFLDAINVLHIILCDHEDDDFATKDAF
ncbi:hypothetical protein AC579_4913 [Pseudocercospora musae]|uniref:Uncharacterized protein n=1 Tax=Pseudocercospora musae TaxID=113226 RepID=A0A139IEE6_9PEZI|nr:hypothetical protein AC579_4913 [Pseudocercospora musae]